jgi:hypothetical protein
LHKKQVKAGAVLNILYALLILFLIYLIYLYFDDIGDRIAVPLLIIILIAFGFGFYELRSRNPITYGLIEIGVGIMTITAIFAPGFDLDHISIDLNFYIKIAAGIYIIARGLTNLSIGTNEKGLINIFKRLLYQ